MTYAYFIGNTTATEYIDNSKLFQYINKIDLYEAYVYIDTLTEKIEIKKLFGKLRSGDTLVVRSIRDTGNNITQLIRVLQWLYEHRINLLSLSEPDYQYSSIIADLGIMDKQYQEKNRVAGFEFAKSQGRITGRPKNPKLSEALKLYQSGKLTAEQIYKITGVSQSTLYRALKDNDKQ